jgi:hypothetical protein
VAVNAARQALIAVGPHEEWWRYVSREFSFFLLQAVPGGDYEDHVLHRSSVKNAWREAWRSYASTRRVLGGILGVWSTKTGLPNDWIEFFSTIFGLGRANTQLSPSKHFHQTRPKRILKAEPAFTSLGHASTTELEALKNNTMLSNYK